ncbi:putative alpha/beta hydrolase [Mycobacterium sp. 050134]|uniref:putative alpha/beta hydrolase n=1 Tax=Mycobacterium sp. 050134 TaxID=3096111 RepID=UPI002EDAF60D
MRLVWLNVADLIARAGGDPWEIDRSLQAGNPAQISSLAEAFHGAGRHTAEADHAFEQARKRFDAAWNHRNGDHPINDSAEVRRVMKSLGAQSERLPRIGADLENVAAALAEAQQAGAGEIAALERQLQLLDKLIGAAMKDLQDPGLDAISRNELRSLINDAKADAGDDTRSALQQLQSIRGGYSNTLQGSLGNLRADGYDPDILRPVDADTRIPPPNNGPEDAHSWWTSLTPEDRQRLIAEHPQELGNLNGVPVAARSDVNEAVMNDDLHRVEDLAKNGISIDDVLADPARYDLSPNAVMRYTNAVQARNGLNTSAKAEDAFGRHPPVYLLKYQPDAFGGEGAAAIAMGDPDTADNTAVVVKGLGSGVREGTLSNPDGVRLYQESARADWNKQTSVIMWVGYDAPNVWYDPGLWEPNMARTGGQLLAADVNALPVTHLGAPSHVTVVGHSYGSTVVSDAAAGFGMHANDVVLVGSPGTDLAHSAADFHLAPGGHLYVGAASGDSVTWSPNGYGPGAVGPRLVGLGDDPSVDGFGATRFKAENPPYTANPIYDHSHYFDDGSESLFSMGDVVSGHGDALQHDGMTAHHRGEYGMPQWVDPEAVRTPTLGHRHSGAAG